MGIAAPMGGQVGDPNSWTNPTHHFWLWLARPLLQRLHRRGIIYLCACGSNASGSSHNTDIIPTQNYQNERRLPNSSNNSNTCWTLPMIARIFRMKKYCHCGSNAELGFSSAYNSPNCCSFHSCGDVPREGELSFDKSAPLQILLMQLLCTDFWHGR